MAGTWPEDQKSARQALRRSIEQGIQDVLDRSGVEMIFRINPPEALVEDPTKLHDFLVSVFALDAALLIERRIARRLLDNLGAPESGQVIRRFADLVRADKRRPNVRESMASTAMSFADEFAKGI